MPCHILTFCARQPLRSVPSSGTGYLMTLASATSTSIRSPPGMRSNRKYRWYVSWNDAYWRMQKGCATFLVMACSQNTCSGHCTTADLRMRFMAYVRPVDSSVTMDTRENAPPPSTVPSASTSVLASLAWPSSSTILVPPLRSSCTSSRWPCATTRFLPSRPGVAVLMTTSAPGLRRAAEPLGFSLAMRWFTASALFSCFMMSCSGPSTAVNVARSRLSTVSWPTARTVAFLGSSFSSACSPKKSDLNRRLTSLPPATTTASPSLMTKNLSPTSPSTMMCAPASYTSSANASTSCSFCSRVRLPSRGTEFMNSSTWPMPSSAAACT
mmetsp:Transcript_18133/g.45667  ORF Transcript_18133/g.45667 Transcript_18133/m.45667 type:complete len:326 (+) Transcript_18133:868-1845(+)